MISNDDLRRLSREAEQANRDALPAYESALTRVIEDDRTPDGLLAEVVGVPSRRDVLKIGGLAVLGGAIVAATGPQLAAAAQSATTKKATATTKAPTRSAMDVSILRTASSIEELAVAAYQIAIDSGLVKTAAVADAAKYFQANHKEHSALFQSLTRKAGGTAFAQANPALLKALDPQIKALKDEKGVVAFAYDLENIAASTYQANVGQFTDATLNRAIMTVGGVEARHATALAAVLGRPPVPKSFQTTTGAVKPGTGV